MCGKKAWRCSGQRTAPPLLAPSPVEGSGTVLALGLQAVSALAVRVELARGLLLLAAAAMLAGDTGRDSRS